MPAAPSWDPTGNYTVVFSDDFSGTTLDTTKWAPGWFGTGITGPVSTGQEPYSSANVSVSSNCLNLGLTPGYGAIACTDPAQVSPGFQFAGGYIEARLNLPADPSGTQVANWPSFWCDGQDWPADGELDIVAGISGQAAYHFQSAAGGPGAVVPGNWSGWHTFGAYWQPGSQVTYYYDGVNVGTITSGITSSPMYIILLNQTGSPAVVPAVMQADWVYVWQNQGGGASLSYSGAVTAGITVTPDDAGSVSHGATSTPLAFRAAPAVSTSGLALPASYAVPKQAGTQAGDWIFVYVYGGGTPAIPGFTAAGSGTVTPPSTLTVETTSLPAATDGTAYVADLAAEGGTGTGYTWSIPSGALPAGLTLSPAGVISGTPTATAGNPLTITTASLAGATVSIAYSATLAATGGSGSGYTWSVSGGSLPAGVTLSTAGVISGTPTSAGTASFTIGVRDSSGNTASQALSIVVAAASSVPQPLGPAAGSWTTLAYDAEFSGTTLDTTKSYASSQGTVNGITPSAANVSVSGGYLRLVLASGSSGALVTTDGALSQFGGPNLFQFTTGMCVEASINFPGPSSPAGEFYNFPAFWTTGQNWPSNGEIDIIECYSGYPVSSYHASGVNDGISAPSGNWANAFHTYTMVRNASSFQIWWDGSLKWNRATSDLGGPHQIIVNTGTISGFPAAYGAASTVLVDYVRVWTP